MVLEFLVYVYNNEIAGLSAGGVFDRPNKSPTGEMMISERLKTARLRAGLSQEKLGKLAGIDPTSASARMNQYERGKHSPDYRLMCRVAEILKMPVSWFYTEDDDLARLQEIFFNMSSDARADLLTHAEALNQKVANVVA
jgi:transcriptional regulator with XRE-family HTH domain